MTTVALPVVDARVPGNSLALWLSLHEPDVYVALWKRTQRAKVAARLQGLGQDDDDSVLDVGGDDDSADYDTSGASLDTSGVLENPEDELAGTSSAAGIAEPAPIAVLGIGATIPVDLSDVTSDALSANFVNTQSPTGQATLSAVSSTPTSSGASVGSIVGSSTTAALQALSAVGQSLQTQAGIQAAANLAAAAVASSTAAAVTATQLNRAAAGQTAAPITYSADGTPIVATGTGGYSALTTQQLAALNPSGLQLFLSQYGVWLLAGAGVIAAVALAAAHREGSSSGKGYRK